jgi:hypothetical protein
MYCFFPLLKDTAPLITTVASLANLGLAIVVFKFARAKHNKDRNIKWFQELVYSPNKEILSDYFLSLLKLKNGFIGGEPISEDGKIASIDLVKKEGEKLLIGFVNMIGLIAPPLYKDLREKVEGLTDKLTTVIDNDELKLEHPNVYEREITNRIAETKNSIYSSIFKYEG